MAKKNKKTINNKQEFKKDSFYAWVSLGLAFFFWVPLLNVILLLPGSMYFGVRAMKMAKRDPEKHGGFWLALISTIFAGTSFIFAAIILVMDITGKI